MPKSLNVVVTVNIPEEFYLEIASADPRARITNAGPLFRVERQVQEQGGKPTEEQAKTLKELETVMREADAIYTVRLPENLSKRCPNLKWAHFMSAGIEDVLKESSAMNKDAIVTNATGCNSIPVAEHVVMFMLMLAKNYRRYNAAQSAHKWDRYAPGELDGQTLGIVGLGHIGEEIVKRVKPFGMNIQVYDPYVKPEKATALGVKIVGLMDIMKDSDFVAVSVPLTKETRHMIGEAQFKAMRKTAYFINTSRGPVIDQAALTKALKEGWFAAAAVDVADPEPLPADSPFWDTPNLTMSGHIAGTTFGMGLRCSKLFAENVRRYLDEKPLLNVVDRARGF